MADCRDCIGYPPHRGDRAHSMPPPVPPSDGTKGNLEVLRKPIGPVSAYAIAKKYGYAGTEEEFATLQAESGNNAKRAETAADRAEQAADKASFVYFRYENGRLIYCKTEDVDNINFLMKEGRLIQQWLS